MKRLCSVLGVSRLSFYYWRRTAADRAARQAADARLAARIRAVRQESDGTYGAPRITAELRETSGEAVTTSGSPGSCGRPGWKGSGCAAGTAPPWRARPPDGDGAARAPGRSLVGRTVDRHRIGSRCRCRNGMGGGALRNVGSWS
ncbi:IS3 family transposase [Streptomyces sp. Act-28]